MKELRCTILEVFPISPKMSSVSGWWHQLCLPRVMDMWVSCSERTERGVVRWVRPTSDKDNSNDSNLTFIQLIPWARHYPKGFPWINSFFFLSHIHVIFY